MQRIRTLAAVVAAVSFVAPASAQMLDSSVIGAFRWRNVGPSNFMGRLSDVQGIPSPSKTIYVSATSRKVTTSPSLISPPSMSLRFPPDASTTPTETWPGMMGYGTASLP